MQDPTPGSATDHGDAYFAPIEDKIGQFVCGWPALDVNVQMTSRRECREHMHICPRRLLRGLGGSWPNVFGWLRPVVFPTCYLS